MSDPLPPLALPPLRVTCTSTDCAHDLHCFKRSKRAAKPHLEGKCRDCGVGIVDWPRVQMRDVGDVAFTFQSLRNELIRHHYWHVEIPQRLVENARRRGQAKLRAATLRRIRSSVGSLPNAYDGRQTPAVGSPKANIVHYGQHAVAACCRKCIEYWHGLERDRALSEQEVTYLAELTYLYVVERLPFLTARGEKIARVRKAAASEIQQMKRTG